MSPTPTRPTREIRADHDDATIVVYQAYRPEIAEAAIAEGRFVEPFSRTRMTWIKPSFAWMMHRCAWATAPGQEHVLALRLTRAGFEEALAQACPSSFEPDIDESAAAWRARLRSSPVRVQWDPERTLRDQRLPWRSIQIGLGSAVVPDFVDRWILELRDITELVRAIRARLDAGEDAAAEALTPHERPYALPPAIARRIGITLDR